MICHWLRSKLGNICDLPIYGPRKVECKGSQLNCSSPLELMLVDSDPVVEEEEIPLKTLSELEIFGRVGP